MKTITPINGISISYITYTNNGHHFHKNNNNILEINYCLDGRIGWNLKNNNRSFLSAGEFAIHTTETCSESEIYLPNKYYEGILITINLNVIKKEQFSFINDFSSIINSISEKFCSGNSSFVFSDSNANILFFNYIKNYFLAPENIINQNYIKLKSMELLLYLYNLDLNKKSTQNEYSISEADIIRTIHKYLLDNIDKKITIEDLSKTFHINTTSLKKTFKGIYGQPIAKYLKIHKMEYASSLLLNTNMKITEIAHSIGYNSCSKFSSCFESIYHILPKDYRKESRKLKLS